MKKLVAGDPETCSADVVAENVAELKALFPEAFTEGKIDFAVLKQLLGGAVDDDDEKYGLNFYMSQADLQPRLLPDVGMIGNTS